ncbi:hypothetical protein VTH82DRAFT_1057 [Thermothelomyces myriococcoides]
MFSRAVEANKAAAPKQPSLAKQLFPSSSPSAGPKKHAENNTIDNMLGKKRPTATSGGSARTVANTKPLQSRSVNTSASGPRVTGKSLASLYNNNSDSFKEEPEAPPPPGNIAQTSDITAVPLYESDFSDDIDLDAECVLPTLPRQQRPETPKEQDTAPPATNTSALSWSQSSPSHLQPAISRSAPPPQNAVKRASPTDDRPDPAAAKKPKRELPKSWSRKEVPEDKDAETDDGHEAAAAMAASKSKGDAFWDTSASAVKAQKKQLKSQLKESGKTETSSAGGQEPPKSYMPRTSAITLSSEQRYVMNLVVEKGQSVFFTGPAGTGKSVLMRAIIQELKKKYARDPERIAVTASTGLAACNIGGMTLHSFAGIGLGKEDTNILVKKIRRNPKAKNRWLKTKVLIIDEISMVDGELFDKLSQIGRTIRNNGHPWGGIQLVTTGDFFQLPPVPEGGKQRESKFAFDAATWNMSIDHTILLTEVFRQRDPEFAAMLNEMRLGKISDKTVRSFQELSRPLTFNDGLEVTELFPTRNEVESSNQRRLKALTGKTYRYDAVDTGDEKIRDKLLANMMAPPTLELKKGAQVMLIKNMDDTLVNGSLGTVVKFMSQTTFEIMGGGDDSEEESDAMRRARAFNKALAQASGGDNKEYPVVCFHAVDGTQRQILCVPEDWKVELPTGEVQASRKQLPLILAWALSIHKAQGQTLERVKVDLGKVFEKGQAYVALSRATTREGLQVLNFQKSKVMAHTRVVEFYRKLNTAEAVMKKKAAGTITNYAVKQPAAAAGSARNPVDVLDDDEAEEEEEEEEVMESYS